MSEKNSPVINEDYLFYEEWVNLINSTYFHRLTEKLSARLRALEVQIKFAAKSNNLDGGISLLVLHARKDEVESLISSFEFYKNAKARLDVQNQQGIPNAA